MSGFFYTFTLMGLICKIGLLLLISKVAFSQKIKMPNQHLKSSVRFTQNKQQWPNSILYKAQLDGGALFVETSGKLTFNLYDKDSYRLRHLGKVTTDKLKCHAYSISFVDANVPIITAKNQSTDYVNYFIGENNAKWASNIYHYNELLFNNIYNDVDATYIGGAQSLKYTFIVKPGGNSNDIKLNYTGVNSIKLKNNQLFISTSVNESVEQTPYVYQILNNDTVVVACKYELKNNIVSFKLLNDYNHSQDLIIDPVLIFSASSGSTADNFGMTATYDSRGNLYTGGTAFDVGYPFTIGAYDVLYNGNAIDGFTDVVITKYDSTGVFLRYSTYLGGATSSEIVTSLIVDKNDNLCLYGATGSADFPTTTGCFDNTFNGGDFLNYPQNGTLFSVGTDIYVAKFNETGNTLMASTYIGGSNNDGVNNNSNTSLYDSLMFNYGDQFRGEIQVDLNDAIYIVSSTKSTNFPTANSFDNSLDGNQDAVLVKLNANLSSILFSTYIGGSNKDCGNALTLDDSLNIYITGGTCSSNFPTTSGSFKPIYNGGKTDGYVCKIKFDGSSILHSTFIGTTVYDQSYFIQLDKNKEVYLYGQTQGVMPITAGVYSKINSKQFIQKLNNSLSTLLASTLVGNSNGQINISPSAFSVDCAGNIYLSGWGASLFTNTGVTSMPITANAIQPTTDGHNFYVMVLGPNMSNLIYGSYFGGAISWEHVDGGTSRFDKKGIIYQSVCAGCSGGSSVDDFPVSPGAWPTALSGTNTNQAANCNNGVFKLDFELNTAKATITTNTIAGCAPLTINYTNASTQGHHYTWDFSNNDTTSVIANPIKTYTAPGTYTVGLYVKTSICDNIYDTSKITITVYPKPSASFSITSDSCSNSILLINQSNPITSSFVWSVNSQSFSAQVNTSYSFSNATNYSIQLLTQNSFGCKDSVKQIIAIPVNSISINPPKCKCINKTVSLSATGGSIYQWLPSFSLSNPSIANPICNATTSTIYTVSITQTNVYGKMCIRSLTTQVTVNPIDSAKFTLTQFACTDSVKATNMSVSNTTLQTISWNFTGKPNSAVNPITQHYLNNGNYNATLLTINAFGCRDSLLKPFSVFNFTTSVTSNDTICRGFISQLNAQGGTSYVWQPNTFLNNATLQNPTSTPSTSINYNVIITNTLSGNTCKDTVSVYIKVNPKIDAAFTNSVGACSNNVYFTDGSSVAPTNWLWSFGNNNSSTLQNPLHYYGSPTSYTVSLITSNVFGCKDTAQQTILLAPFTPISVNSNINKCGQDTVQLQATGGIKYLWIPATGLSNANIANPLAFPSVNTTYSVIISTLKGTDTCNSVLTTQVNLYSFNYNAALITISATTLTLGQSSTITLVGFPTTNTVIISPATNISNQLQNTFIVTPTKSGEYSIYTYDDGNCLHVLKTINVFVQTNSCNDATVFLPTGFTPNNDGVNDVLFIRSNFITEVYLTIYDRWGEKLFETSDEKIGWNGTYKGKQLDQGVYGYYMTFKCNNGEQSFKKGNITLMR